MVTWEDPFGERIGGNDVAGLLGINRAMAGIRTRQVFLLSLVLDFCECVVPEVIPWISL